MNPNGRDFTVQYLHLSVNNWTIEGNNGTQYIYQEMLPAVKFPRLLCGDGGGVFIKVFHIHFSFVWNFSVTEITAAGSFFIKSLFIVIYFYVFGLTFVAFYLNLLLVQSSIYSTFSTKNFQASLKEKIIDQRF